MISARGTKNNQNLELTCPLASFMASPGTSLPLQLSCLQEENAPVADSCSQNCGPGGHLYLELIDTGN
jgi:hypothetical protein